MNYIIFSLVVFFILSNVVVFAHADLISHWKFDDNLNDSGPAKNNLSISEPIFLCDDSSSYSACWTESNAKLYEEFYFTGVVNNGFYFNRFTYLVTDPSQESDYDFLDVDKSFTIDFWASGEPYCIVTDQCTHQYLFSKSMSTPEDNPNVIGIAGGIQRDGSFYLYLRNDHEIMYAQTDATVFDTLPHKYTVVYTGNGARVGINFFVDGEHVQLHPPTGDAISVPRIFDSVSNDEAFVIGNYWYTFGQSFGDGWIDEFKIYDHALSSQEIMNDYNTQISKNEKLSNYSFMMSNISYDFSILGYVVISVTAIVVANFAIIRYYYKKISKQKSF